MQDFNFLLFDGFETLDAFGPAEMLGQLTEEYELKYLSHHGGIVKSQQGVPVDTVPVARAKRSAPLLIPGGLGTRKLIESGAYIAMLKDLCEDAAFVLTVCTGSALLANTHLIDGRRATSNKNVFAWASAQGTGVRWQKHARWVCDGKYYTSSGVSAGMDMTLAFIEHRFGKARAQEIARYAEYVWNDDAENDPFAAE